MNISCHDKKVRHQKSNFYFFWSYFCVYFGYEIVLLLKNPRKVKVQNCLKFIKNTTFFKDMFLWLQLPRHSAYDDPFFWSTESVGIKRFNCILIVPNIYFIFHSYVVCKVNRLLAEFRWIHPDSTKVWKLRRNIMNNNYNGK